MKRRIRFQFGSARGTGTLGTFSGVFTPSILTILGIILFRRLGYVVGAAGLWQTLLIIAVANSISVLTSLSLSAIATNFRVKGGGDYYLISRTLGLEFGGAIGIVLFLAQAVSIAFYCIGLGEVVAAIAGFDGDMAPRLIAAGCAAFLFIFAWLGADWATRLQFIVMVTLIAALASFFAGGVAAWSTDFFRENLARPEGGLGFWVIFAIFFPAVTGFTQGVSMSGDLKDPSRSIPTGTFAAVGLSSIVYVVAALLFAAGLPLADMRADYGIMSRLARWGWLIEAGVIAATVSSAMASFLGAPRILQALAKDRIFRSLVPFAKGVGPSENPRRGVLLSAAIAALTIAVGDLNLIAPIVSMFFLISYGLINYATYFQIRAGSPSFRPRFRWFHRRLSLLGALGCLGVMLAINLTAGLVSVSLLFGIYQFLKHAAGPARWADSSRAYLFQRVRESLLAMDSVTAHARDWRPQILALSRDKHRREQILRFASWIEGKSGITTAVRLVEGERDKIWRSRGGLQRELAADIADYGLSAFPLVVAGTDLRASFENLVQSYGVGPLRANIVLINWVDQLPETVDPSSERSLGRYLRDTIRLGCNLVILDSEKDEWEVLAGLEPGRRRIDVWWWGYATSHLMLLLSYLMTRTEPWSGARIRVFAASEKKNPERTRDEMVKILDAVRIDAEAIILPRFSHDVIVEHSADASLVFLPIRLRGNQPVDPFGERLEPLLTALPVVALALAAEDIPLVAEPDEGLQAQIADAVQAAEEADKALRTAEKEQVLAEELESLRSKAETAWARAKELGYRNGRGGKSSV